MKVVRPITMMAIAAVISAVCAAPSTAQAQVDAPLSVDGDASWAGIEVLGRGGNAVDAAVAAAATLGVTEPYSAGIGGGGFFVYFEVATHRVLTLDGRETAPAAMGATAFIDPATGQPLPFADALTGIVVPGRGFLLNNELTAFNFAPTQGTQPDPNLPGAGKRPRSSLAPTIILRNGVPVLAVGSPGGATIITTVLQILVNRLDLGMTLPEAIAAPRASQRNTGTTEAEPEFLNRYETALRRGANNSAQIRKSVRSPGWSFSNQARCAPPQSRYAVVAAVPW